MREVAVLLFVTACSQPSSPTNGGGAAVAPPEPQAPAATAGEQQTVAAGGLRYELSTPETFLTPSQTNAAGAQFGPSDGPFGAIPIGGGRYRFLGAARGGPSCPERGRRWGAFAFTGTLDRVESIDGCEPVVGVGEGPAGWAFDANYVGGGRVTRFADRGHSGWLLSFRGEQWWDNPEAPDHRCRHVPCYYSTLGLAVSTDGGMTFRVAGESLQLADALPASKGGPNNRNIGYGSLVVADAQGRHLDNPPPDPSKAFFYLFFVESAPDLPGVCSTRQCAGVARAPYSSLVDAALAPDPHAVARVFRKYDASERDPWSQPATGDSPDLGVAGGRFSPLFSDDVGGDIVLYDRAFDLYLMAANTPHGVTLRSSRDLLHWSGRLGPPIVEPGKWTQYGNLLGETGDPNVAGVEPRVYFRSKPEEFSKWSESATMVVRVRLSAAR